ncbi:unnamed protein product [Merluccius merluccius]
MLTGRRGASDFPAGRTRHVWSNTRPQAPTSLELLLPRDQTTPITSSLRVMAPLSSPSGCVSCACLAEKIQELERRISSLHQIQEAEKLLNTIIFAPPYPDSTGAMEPDPIAPSTAAAPLLWSPLSPLTVPPGNLLDPPESVSIHRTPTAAPPPFIPDVSWTRLGAKSKAKPKALVSSTPSQQEHWSQISARTRKTRQNEQRYSLSLQPCSKGILLKKRSSNWSNKWFNFERKGRT